jgi:hypothetical protein
MRGHPENELHMAPRSYFEYGYLRVSGGPVWESTLAEALSALMSVAAPPTVAAAASVLRHASATPDQRRAADVLERNVSDPTGLGYRPRAGDRSPPSPMSGITPDRDPSSSPGSELSQTLLPRNLTFDYCEMQHLIQTLTRCHIGLCPANPDLLL